MSWGTGPWGTGPWASVSATFNVVRAFALSESSVVVELSSAPQDLTLVAFGDVRNPTSWGVTRLDTSAPFPVLEVVPHSPADFMWEVRVLGRFPGSPRMCRVRATNLKAATGAPVTAPAYADFLGVQWAATATADGQAAQRGFGTRDLRNLPAPQIEGTSLGGTLQVSGGDYVLEDGAQLVRKLILRRLTATPGDFFHLPKYGVGLRVKQPLPVASVVLLQAEIRRQIQAEPDVEGVTASVEQGQNVFVVRVSATLKRTGQRVDVAERLPLHGTRI